MPGQIYPTGGSIYLKFTTRAFSTGIPTTLAGSPVVSIYKDDSLTQSTAGVTLTVDFDSVTGLNHVTIDTTADATFYANGHTFYLVITTGTVSSVSVVGEAVGNFDLAATATTAPTAAAVATAVWQDTTAGDFTVSSSIGKSLYTSGAVPGAAGGLFIAGANAATTFASLTVTTTTTLTGAVSLGSTLGVTGATTFTGVVTATNGIVANITGNLVGTVSTLTTYTGNTPQTGDSYARIGATGSGLTSLAPSSTALSTATWTSGRATNLDNLDATISSVLAAVSNIAVTSAALNATSSSATYTTGTSTGGATNTYTLDGVFDSVAAVGNAIDIYYEFDLSATSGATAVGATWDGYLVGAVNTIKVYAYNWGGSSWDQVGNITGIAGTVVSAQEFDLTSSHTGTGGNLGKARIRFAATGLTTGTLKTDRILLGYAVVVIAPSNFSSLAITVAGGVTLADGVTHGGSTAQLSLKSVVVNNPSGHAVLFESSSSGGSALILGAFGGGGANALWVLNTSGGDGVNISAPGNGLYVGGGPTGILASATSGHAVSLQASGNGIRITTTAGHAISLSPQDGDGIHIAPELSANSAATGISVVGAGTGSGFDGTLSPGTLASYFLVDTTKVYSNAVSGSVVKEIASNAGSSDPDVVLSSTLGSQSLGDVNHIVLPSGPSDNGVLAGARLRITSGVAQYQERTISGWNGTDKIAGIDENFVPGTPESGDTFEVRYDHSHQLDSGSVLSIAYVTGISAGALSQFFSLDSGQVYADAVDGSVVKETAGNATVSGTVDANIVQIGGVASGDDVEQTGTASTFFGRMRQLYNRFFPEGPSGEVVKNSGTHTIVTKDSTGSVITTQQYTDDGSGNETIGPAS